MSFRNSDLMLSIIYNFHISKRLKWYVALREISTQPSVRLHSQTYASRVDRLFAKRGHAENIIYGIVRGRTMAAVSHTIQRPKNVTPAWHNAPSVRVTVAGSGRSKRYYDRRQKTSETDLWSRSFDLWSCTWSDQQFVRCSTTIDLVNQIWLLSFARGGAELVIQ